MDLLAPNVLIMGHSFVRDLKGDLSARFDPRVREDFGLSGTANVHSFGVGSRTVSFLRNFDLPMIIRIAPEIVILEIGTYELSEKGLELVASQIEDLARLLLREFSVRVVRICHVIPRGPSCRLPAPLSTRRLGRCITS